MPLLRYFALAILACLTSQAHAAHLRQLGRRLRRLEA